MHKTLAMLGLFAMVGLASAAQAAIVDLDGVANSGPNSSNAVSVMLGVGTYDLAPVIGAYTAFNPYGIVTGCDGSGANCTEGWNWRFFADPDPLVMVNPGFAPPMLGQYFATPELAFANAPALGRITVTAPTTLRFWVPDGAFVADNLGGVSFNVTAVPEPAAWALMIAGFSLAGAALRRRRRKSGFAASSEAGVRQWGAEEWHR